MKVISESARLYALRELSRRAGVTWEFFRDWAIEQRDDVIVVRAKADSPGEIRFPHYRGDEWELGRVVRKAWERRNREEIPDLVPDLIVPFCRRASVEGEALFVQQSPDVFACTEDLLASVLLTLCRFEERNAHEQDIHGRFPASASIAVRCGFLHRPIVDEYGLAFEQVLKRLVPEWQPSRRTVRVKVSHDIDQLGIPFRLKSVAGHLVQRGAPLACFRDLLSLVGAAEPSYLDAVRVICQLGLDRGLRPAVYWKASMAGPHDTGYDITDARVNRVMDWAKSRGVEMGVHPAYDTFLSRQKLSEEVMRCRKAVGAEKMGGRQHYLRWRPETWADWESCELQYDSSVGFADQYGFRAGTCVPYFPWLWEQDRPAKLLEIPLVVMDGTLVQYMRLAPEQSLNAVRELIKRCEIVGGVFSILWHNSSLLQPFAHHYLPIFDALTGMENYEWEEDFTQLGEETRMLHDKGWPRV